MKRYFLFLIAFCLLAFSVNSCKKEDEPCAIAFRYTIVDSITLEPLIGYHSSARYDPDLFEFRMNVKAEKDISYQIGADSGVVFTIRLANILEDNVINNSLVFYDAKAYDSLAFISRSPAPGLEAIISWKMISILNDEVLNESMARMNCVNNNPVIDTLKIKQ